MSRKTVVSGGVVAGNVYDKYETTNPVARRLMAGFDREMRELLARTEGVASVLEVGCGEGHVTRKLRALFPRARVVGTDFSPEIVEAARRLHPGLVFEVRSVYDLEAVGERFDLVVASEMLEHLERPAEALEHIARAAGRYVFASVPREPIWRVLNVLRGKYLGAGGNTPGHLQHWSRNRFLEFMGRRLEIVDVRSPLPWTQVLARVRGTGE